MKISRQQAIDLGIVPDQRKRPRQAQCDVKAAQSLFIALCESWGLPRPEPEYQFASPRKWRFDWAWPLHRLALEIQGGLFTGGRHVRGAALLAEQEKLNEAAILGWRVLYCQPADVKSGAVFQLLARLLTK